MMRRLQFNLKMMLGSPKNVARRAGCWVWGALIVALISWMGGDLPTIFVASFFVTGTCCMISIGRFLALPQFRLIAVLKVIACISLILASLINNTPFRARYLLSRRAINELANEAATGRLPPLPCRAGLFLVRGVEANRMVVKLWTGGLGPNSSGRIGFARGIGPDEPRYFWQSRMDDDWWYVVED